VIIIGCDCHPGFQQIAYVHGRGRTLRATPGTQGRGRTLLPRPQKRCMRVHIGMEASGYARRFERFLAELQLRCGLATLP